MRGGRLLQRLHRRPLLSHRGGRCLARGGLVASFLAEAWRDECPGPIPENLAAIEPLLLSLGAGALAWWRIRGLAPGGPAADRLHAAYRFHAMQALLHERGVAEAFRLLRSSRAEPLLGKGWAAARLYPEVGLRPYGDVDLYVREGAYGAARAAVESPANSGEAYIDLHCGFGALDDRSPEELYRRSLVASAAGEDVRLLGPEDHLRLLCLHLLTHGACRPLWLCDVAAALESRGPDFDWDYFMQGDALRTDAVGCAVTLAAQLLRALTDGVPQALAPRPLPAWVVRAVLLSWGDPSFTPHGRRAPMAHLRGPGEILRGLGQRWPNPIEATMARGGRFDDAARLPLQLAECVARIARFARSRIRGGRASEAARAWAGQQAPARR